MATGTWEKAYQSVEHDLRERIKKISAFDLGRSNLRVLDLGCGDGIDMEAFRGLGYKDVIGVDLATNLLKRLDRKANKVLNADVYALAVKDETFDLVYGNNVLHHFLDLDRAFSEIRRVLCKGGFFCFAEPNNTTFRWLVDRVTLSPLASLAPLLAHRRVILEEEMDDYQAWLHNQGSLFSKIEQQNFQLMDARKGIFRLYSKWQAV